MYLRKNASITFSKYLRRNKLICFSGGPRLTAIDVSSASGFMGVSQNLSNTKIIVTYSDTALQKLEITYNTTNSTVTTMYEFTK